MKINAITDKISNQSKCKNSLEFFERIDYLLTDYSDEKTQLCFHYKMISLKNRFFVESRETLSCV